MTAESHPHGTPPGKASGIALDDIVAITDFTKPTLLALAERLDRASSLQHFIASETQHQPKINRRRSNSSGNPKKPRGRIPPRLGSPRPRRRGSTLRRRGAF